MSVANWYQRFSFPVLFLAGIVSSAPGGNPNCQVDGSREPVCDGSGVFFSHQFDCGKFWECGPDLKPCLFECPAISEDIGGGTLFFNSEIAACDWPVNVDCQDVATTEAETRPTRPEPTTPEPTTPEPTRPEPTRPEPTTPEPTRPDTNSTRPTRPEPTRPEPTRPESTTPEPTRPDTRPTRPEPTRPEPTRPE